MTIAWKSWAAAAAFISVGAAHAATQTLFVGGSVQADSITYPWGDVHRDLADLNGRLSWQFSSLFVNTVNAAKLNLDQVSPANLSTTTNAASKLASGSMDTFVASLTGAFGDGQALIQQVATSGGLTLSSLKNGFTNGAGALQITNLRLDLPSGAVFADIVGANGIGVRSDFHLWDYASVSGATTYAPPSDWSCFASLDCLSWPRVRVSNNFHGLFATSEGFELIAQALNFNEFGRNVLGSVNDPLRGDGAGFGSLSVAYSVAMNGPVTISLAVPEPSSWAMWAVGVVGLRLAVRRRQQRSQQASR